MGAGGLQGSSKLPETQEHKQTIPGPHGLLPSSPFSAFPPRFPPKARRSETSSESSPLRLLPPSKPLLGTPGEDQGHVAPVALLRSSSLSYWDCKALRKSWWLRKGVTSGLIIPRGAVGAAPWLGLISLMPPSSS